MNLDNLMKIAIESALIAGEKILEIYNQKDFDIKIKNDNSPLTIADIEANKIINDKLLKTNYNIVSEEGLEIDYRERTKWKYFWLVDPIDGTKEFIKRNGEFTVNIALIENNVPVLGVVYAPFLRELFYADKIFGSFKIKNVQSFEDVLHKKPIDLSMLKPPSNYTIIVSKSHMNDETQEYIKKLESYYKNITKISFGSSLKICRVADRTVNCYPRFGPTMEWDTAAAHAVAKYSGCSVKNKDEKSDLVYNKKSLLNPFFIVKSL